ncbi:MAG: DUF4835 family protein [Bacteroidota bacterium]|nr:DUF4835 family protein [Bacteroidota bacterium]
MTRLVLLLILLLQVVAGTAQEFNVQVQVIAPQIQGTDRRVFETLQKSLYEFVNDRKWSPYIVRPEERIEGSILITISEHPASDQFRGKINVILQRPVYKTTYNSSLLNYADNDFRFNYVESQPLDYSDNNYTSNITSVIAFYLNVFLGMDGDSFSSMGGTFFFQKAQDIVNAAQSSSDPGWKAFESQRNRYWMAENYLNPSYSVFREAIYKYHRLGLDVMADQIDQGRSAISESLDDLRRVYRERPGLFVLQLFLGAKRDEIINIFSKASPADQTKAVNILREIDPANANKYQQILQNK